MKIEKLRHGSEISSEKLNEIINAVNDNESTHENIKALANTIKQESTDIKNELSRYEQQIGENIESIPEIKEIFANILLARDTADWIDLDENATDLDAFISDALSKKEENQSSKPNRLTIIRGTTDQINLTNPTPVDKQIVIAYSTETNGGIIYFDCFDSKEKRVRRIPISSNYDTTITMSIPEFELESVSENCIKIKRLSNGEVVEETTLTAPSGPKGESIIGPKGEKGDPGPQGIQGIQGPAGKNGSTTLIEIKFSNDSTGTNASYTYNGHKYIGIRVYLDSDTSDEKNSRPFQWFSISSDTFYPVYNEETGYLTFTTEPSEVNSYYIKGPQGPIGPQGKPPKIAFRKINPDTQEEETIDVMSTIIDTVGDSETEKYIFNADLFKGDKGEKGEKGDPGPQGIQGNTPNILFSVEHTDKEDPQIKDITPDVSDEKTKQWLLSIPKGKDGTIITRADKLSNGTIRLIYNDGNYIDLLDIKGDKGDPGENAPGIIFKGNYTTIDDLPTEGVENGFAYAVDKGDQKDLYVCVKPTATTVNDMYINLGNIKGTDGYTPTIGSNSNWYINNTDTGKPSRGERGATIFNGESITSAGDNIGINLLMQLGDYYLNSKTFDLYQITAATHNPNSESGTYTIKKICNIKGEKGDTGDDGISIKDVSIASTDNYEGTQLKRLITVTLSDDTKKEFTLLDGKTGATGKGVSSITNDGNEGTNSKLKVTYTDNSTSSLLVPNGIDGRGILNLSITSIENNTKTRVVVNYTDGTKSDNIDIPHGIDGTRGNQITYSTTTTPTGTNPIKGDLCITSNFQLYEYNGSSWGSSLVKLQGADGVTPTISFATPTTLAAGSNATVTTSKSGNHTTVTLGIPRGSNGANGTYTKASLDTSNTSNTPSITMTQSTYYKLGGTAITKITLKTGTVTSGTVGEFMCEFTLSSTTLTGGISITNSSGATIPFANGWTTSDFISKYKYIIYIINDTAFVSYVPV